MKPLWGWLSGALVGTAGLCAGGVGLGVSGWLAYLASISLVTFCFYGVDKRRAVRSGRRIPEAVLHVLALAGGTVGAALGQGVFHHKTQKRGFRVVWMLIVLLQVGLVVAYVVWRD